MTCATEPVTADIDDALRALAARGFQFLHPRDANGELTAVVGIRAHDKVIDVVFLRAESDARAVRMPGDTVDILAPDRTLWARSGNACDVLTELLALPNDHTPGAMTSSTNGGGGCWVPVRAGTARWLAATG
jgi:hypothetical protein